MVRFIGRTAVLVLAAASVAACSPNFTEQREPNTYLSSSPQITRNAMPMNNGEYAPSCVPVDHVMESVGPRSTDVLTYTADDPGAPLISLPSDRRGN